MHEVDIVLENHRSLFQHSIPLHVHRVIGVYQDVADCGVLQQRLQRTQAKYLVEHFAGEHIAFHGAQGNSRLPQQLVDHHQQLLPRQSIGRAHQLFQVKLADQLTMHGGLQFLIAQRPAVAAGSVRRHLDMRRLDDGGFCHTILGCTSSGRDLC